MRDSMGRFMPGHDRSNISASGDSESESYDEKNGVETTTRRKHQPQIHSQSGFHATSKASGHGHIKARGDSHTNRQLGVSTPQLQSIRELIRVPEIDFPTADMRSTDDPFDEFEVESGSEKDFLIAHLKNDAPRDEVEQLKNARKPLSIIYASNTQHWNTGMNQEDFEETTHIAQDENSQHSLSSLERIAPHLVLREQVEAFARSHMFTVNKLLKPTTLQRREFTRDIYDYARAVGMGKYEADAEVLLAKAAYRRDRSLPGGLRLDESDDESALGLEISDAVKYITSMTSGMQRSPIDPAAAWGEISRLRAKCAQLGSGSKKRKRGIANSHSMSGGAVASRRLGVAENSRLSKKHKRRKRKRRYSNGDIQEPAEFADTPPIPKSRKERGKAMRRKRSILGRPEGSMDIISEDMLPHNITSKRTPTPHSGLQHIGEDSGGETYGQAVSAENGVSLGLMPTENLKLKSFISKIGIKNDAAGDSWNMRKKKKKNKRKRKGYTVNGSGKITGSLGENTKAELAHKSTNINSAQIDKALLNMDHLHESSRLAADDKMEIVIKDDTNNSSKAVPLSELMSTNSNKKMQGSRDRGMRKKGIAPTLQASTSVAIEPVKDYHSQKRKGSTREARDNQFESDGEADENSNIFTTVSQIPETKSEVLAQTPSKTWWPLDMAKSDGKVEYNDLDSSTSVLESTFSEDTGDHAFTMSERSLDWDHSGPEFDEIKVEPKVTRSSPLKQTVTTPWKASRIKASSTNLQTPESNRKLRNVSNQSFTTLSAQVQHSHEGGSTTRNLTKAPVKSPFFSPPASPKKKSRVKGGLVSCIPFPPLSSPSFGLLQEKLYHDPFRLLVGVTFLNRTIGKHAIPVFFSLMEKYPTPADILAADKNDIISITRHLGLQAQRAETYKKFAHFWIHDPPIKGKRYRVDHYPEPGDGMDIRANEVVDDDDPRVAWEIAHMTKGRYAIDSWRIFCRDILRGESEGWNGEGREDGFQPEWMRVQPRDKELIACLRWMWLKEGFSWDPVTGEKEVADRELMEAAIAGNIAWDDRGGMRIVENDDDANNDLKVETENEDESE